MEAAIDLSHLFIAVLIFLPRFPLFSYLNEREENREREREKKKKKKKKKRRKKSTNSANSGQIRMTSFTYEIKTPETAHRGWMDAQTLIQRKSLRILNKQTKKLNMEPTVSALSQLKSPIFL